MKEKQKKSFSFKNVLKVIWNEFVYGGHLVSISTTLVVLSVLLIINRFENLFLLLLISYLLPQIVYGFNYLKEVKSDFLTNPERASHLNKNLKVRFYFIFFYVVLGIILLYSIENYYGLVLFSIIVIAGLFYPKDATKKVVGFKSIYVAFFWALIVFLPYLYYSLKLNLAVFLFFIFVFLRALLNTIFFDIKDIESDHKEGLKTIPIVLSTQKTITLLYVINILSFIPLAIGLYSKSLPNYVLSLGIFFFYSLYYIKEAQNTKSLRLRQISYVMVDGEYALWPIFLLLSQLIFR